MKRGQSFVLYLNDRVWDAADLTSNRTDLIQADYRAWSDQGTQAGQRFELLPPKGGSHLGRGPTRRVLQLDDAPSESSGSDAPRAAAPTSPREAPGVVGTWSGTFKNGSTATFEIRDDKSWSGDNGARGTWTQTGRRVTFTSDDGTDWKGSLDEDGDAFTVTTDSGGRLVCKRH